MIPQSRISDAIAAIYALTRRAFKLDRSSLAATLEGVEMALSNVRPEDEDAEVKLARAEEIVRNAAASLRLVEFALEAAEHRECKLRNEARDAGLRE